MEVRPRPRLQARYLMLRKVDKSLHQRFILKIFLRSRFFDDFKKIENKAK